MFTTKEREAFGVVLEALYKWSREDIGGVLLKTGAFRCLDDSDEAVVTLARKIKELADPRIKQLCSVEIPNDEEAVLGDNFHSFIDTFCGVDTDCEPNTVVRITVERVEINEQ